MIPINLSVPPPVPQISRLQLSPRAFANVPIGIVNQPIVPGPGPVIPVHPITPDAAVAQGALILRGTTVTYTLTEPATVTVRAERMEPGVRVGARCVRQGDADLQSSGSCTRFVPIAGSLVLPPSQTTVRFTFSGFAGQPPLAIGSYALVARPSTANPEQRGAPVAVRFRIIAQNLCSRPGPIIEARTGYACPLIR